MMNTKRYTRQMILPHVGLSGQQALNASKVLLVGAGGLGLPCAQSLVAAGVGQITIIDDDRVSLSNLHRQYLFNEADVGRYKVEALHDRLSGQNSDVRISYIRERLNMSNAPDLIAAHDLVIDGSDNFATKFLINDTCLIKKIPWIYGSVSRFEGQLAVFSSKPSKQHSCYRCLYEKMPTSKIENCAEQGVFGAVTGIIGNYQALEALKILIEINSNKKDSTLKLLNSKTDILHIFDFQTMEQQSLFISKRTTCICEKPELIQLKDEDSAVCFVEAEKSWNAFVRDENIKILFDVRSQEEFQAGHHKLGQFWGPDTMQKLIHTEFTRSESIYLYCATGKRAREKCFELREKGIFAYHINEHFEL